MTALAKDKEVARKEGGLQSFPVTSGEIIYKGAMVCVDADGYLLAADDVAGYKFVGIAYEKCDNSGGGDGVKSCRVYTEGAFLLTCTSINQTMVGRLLYVVDDQTVDESTTNSVCAGRLVKYESDASGWVDIGQRALSAVAGTIYGETSITGALSVGGTPISAVQIGGLGVAGPVVFESTFRCQGRFILNNELACSALTVGGHSILNGNLNVGGILGVQGAVTLNNILNVNQDVTFAEAATFIAYCAVIRLAGAAIYLSNIPASPPAEAKRLYHDAGTVKIVI